jgi:hypothetical protein
MILFSVFGQLPVGVSPGCQARGLGISRAVRFLGAPGSSTFPDGNRPVFSSTRFSAAHNRFDQVIRLGIFASDMLLLLHRQAGAFIYSAPELVFVFFVGVHFHGSVPGIEMSSPAAVVDEIARGA